MPQYLTPGVYIEEVPGARPIEGVGTATGAFVGVAEKGPIGEAVLITNWTQYTSVFGGYIANGYLPHAVNNFFTEGGTKCYVVRTCHYNNVTQASSKTATRSTLTLEDRGTPKNTLKVDALSEGSWGDAIAVVISRATKDPVNKFDLAILYDGVDVEKYSELEIGDVEGAINGVSKYVMVADQRSTTTPPNNQPALSTVDLNDRNTAAQPTLEIAALRNVTVSVVDTGDTFTLSVTPSGGAAVDFPNLTMANVEAQVNGAAVPLIRVRNLNSTRPAPTNKPKTGAVAGLIQPTEIVDRAAAPLPTLSIVALQSGVSYRIDDGANANTFKLTVSTGTGAPLEFDNLTLANVEATVNTATSPVRVRDLSSPTAAPNNIPAVTTPAAPALATLQAPVRLEDRAAPQPTLRVTALAKGLNIAIADGTPPDTFKLTINQNASVAEVPYDNLKIEDIERKINGISEYIRVQNLKSSSPPPLNRPANSSQDLRFFALGGGWDGLAGVLFQDRATPNARNTLLVSAWRDGVTVSIENSTTDPTNRFKIIVKAGGAKVEEFDNLTMATVEQRINEQSAYIEVDNQNSSTAVPANRPAVQADVAVPIGLWDSDFIGDEGAKNGLHAFDPVDDINIVAIPERPGDREVIIGAYTYCQNRKDCFFVADAPLGLTPQEAQQFKEGTGNTYAGTAFNSSYAALYYPWIYVSDPLTGKNKLVPPSGAVAGSYSYTDVARGVHKAPAGINEGYLNSAVGIERIVTKGEQGLLNPARVNVIRSFPASGIVIWGTRTLSADTAVLYINVRRLLLFIEESIDEGSQWVVFEPNDRTLWAAVKRDVTAFLTTVWRSGALFGSTAAEAFFVKIDDENNPPESRDLGRLIIDVGVAPVKPAEFVIFRISQIVQGAKG